MLRRIAVAIAIVLTAGTLFGGTVSAQPIRTIPGVGGDMTCDLATNYRIRTADGYALQISQTAPTGRVIQHWVWGGTEVEGLQDRGQRPEFPVHVLEPAQQELPQHVGGRDGRLGPVH